MSLKHMDAAWESDLPPTDRLVLLALANWADKLGRCWPSIPQVATRTGVHERTVRLAIGRLEAGGHLTRKSVIGKGTRYRLALPDPPDPIEGTPGVAPTPGATPTPGAAPTPGVAPGTPGVAPTNTPAIPQERKKTSSSPSTRQPRNAIEALPDLPPGASDQQWADYVEMRVGMSRGPKPKPWTPSVARKAIDKLRDLAAAGHDPGAVLDQSVLNGWQGLFPVKDDKDGRSRRPAGADAVAGPRRGYAADMLAAAHSRPPDDPESDPRDRGGAEGEVPAWLRRRP